MEKIKINPGNCVKLNSGIVALITKDEKLVHIKTGEIISSLKKYDDNLRNIPMKTIGETNFDIEKVYEDIELKKTIFSANRYDKNLVKYFVDKDFEYFYRDEEDNYFVSREEPVIVEHYFKFEGKEHIVSKIVSSSETTFNLTILADLLPHIEQNTYENFKNFIEKE